jgi:hypothetical protein
VTRLEEGSRFAGGLLSADEVLCESSCIRDPVDRLTVCGMTSGNYSELTKGVLAVDKGLAQSSAYIDYVSETRTEPAQDDAYHLLDQSRSYAAHWSNSSHSAFALIDSPNQRYIRW